jgi:hypothetical protein
VDTPPTSTALFIHFFQALEGPLAFPFLHAPAWEAGITFLLVARGRADRERAVCEPESVSTLGASVKTTSNTIVVFCAWESATAPAFAPIRTQVARGLGVCAQQRAHEQKKVEKFFHFLNYWKRKKMGSVCSPQNKSKPIIIIDFDERGTRNKNVVHGGAPDEYFIDESVYYANSHDIALDISGIDKLELLQEMWNNASPASVFITANITAPMFDKTDAQRILAKEIPYFDYFQGRAIKSLFRGDTINPYRYDDYHGMGKCARIIDRLLGEKEGAPTNRTFQSYKSKLQKRPLAIT